MAFTLNCRSTTRGCRTLPSIPSQQGAAELLPKAKCHLAFKRGLENATHCAEIVGSWRGCKSHSHRIGPKFSLTRSGSPSQERNPQTCLDPWNSSALQQRQMQNHPTGTPKENNSRAEWSTVRKHNDGRKTITRLSW